MTKRSIYTTGRDIGNLVPWPNYASRKIFQNIIVSKRLKKNSQSSCLQSTSMFPNVKDEIIELDIEFSNQVELWNYLDHGKNGRRHCEKLY